MAIPNKRNFCGGNFQDWLEVMLTSKCNGSCSWCIEKEGYRPTEIASTSTLCDRIVESGKKNIILLGGEPTLYWDLFYLVRKLTINHGLDVYITTNGSTLSPRFIHDLGGIKGINISIHSYDLSRNKTITGISLDKINLKETIQKAHRHEVIVRLNCNIIKHVIDHEAAIDRYILFAKEIGADSIRFAELKNDSENFVGLDGIYGDKYDINNEPFGLGCNTDVVINDMPVNFRQMCGLQTTLREKPINPQQIVKRVLYYDGVFYDGWQTREEHIMTEKEILELLIKVVDKDISIIEAAKLLVNKDNEIADIPESSKGSGCQY